MLPPNYLVQLFCGMVDAVLYYRIKKNIIWRFVMKITKHIVEFVGGFAIGALGALALAGFQTLVNKAFDKEKKPRVVETIDELWQDELPF
jgi:hypothetical protein